MEGDWWDGPSVDGPSININGPSINGAGRGTCGTIPAPKLGDRKEMGGMVEPRLGGRKIPPLVCPGTGCPALKAGKVALAATEAEAPPPSSDLPG